MGLINYLGESKIIKRICQLLNVTDVKVDGTSVVDENGVANIPSGGTDVEWTQEQLTGTKIAEIEIDGDSQDVLVPNTFNDLSDTNFINLQNGQVAKYNSSTHKWENQNDSSVTSFDALTDVSIDGDTLADGQVPKWNATTQKWENQDESGGGAGHTILSDSGTDLPQEGDLQFKGVYVHDDSINEKTVVEVARKMTRYQFEQLSDEEKKGLIQIEDEVENDLMIVNGCFIDTRNVIQASTPITSSANVSYTATQDCIVEFTLIAAQNNSSWANIDGKNIWENYCSSGVSQFTNIAHLKKGQVITFHQTYTAGNGHYIVYGIQQGTDWHAPDYSTTEHKIGRKWIDGKDIYEITLTIPALSSTDNIINHGISNFGKMIHCEGTINYDGDDLELPYISNVANNGYVQYGMSLSNFNSTRYMILLGPSFNRSKFSDGYVTVQYTKTS